MKVAVVGLGHRGPNLVRNLCSIEQCTGVVACDVKIYDKRLAVSDPQDFGEDTLTYRTGDIVPPKIETSELLRLELQDFFSRVEKGERPADRETAAAAVVTAIERAHESLLHRGAPVEI